MTARDYFELDRSYAQRRADPGSQHGDFDYSGAVNADDYLLIDLTYFSRSSDGIGGLGGCSGRCSTTSRTR